MLHAVYMDFGKNMVQHFFGIPLGMRPANVSDKIKTAFDFSMKYCRFCVLYL